MPHHLSVHLGGLQVCLPPHPQLSQSNECDNDTQHRQDDIVIGLKGARHDLASGGAKDTRKSTSRGKLDARQGCC